MSESSTHSVADLIDSSHPAQIRRRRWRLTKDTIARNAVGIGGVGVIIAIVLIFFYLLYVVLPLFEPAHSEAIAKFRLPEVTGNIRFETLEEQNEVAAILSDRGEVQFFDVHSGKTIKQVQLPIPAEATITSFAKGDLTKNYIAYGFSDGSVLILKHIYKLSYPNDKRVITPDIEFPFGKAPLQLGEKGERINKLALNADNDQATILALIGANELVSLNIEKNESLLEDEITLERTESSLLLDIKNIATILIDKEQRNAYISSDGNQISHYDLSDKSEIKFVQRVTAVEDGRQITSLVFLAGDLSLLVGDSSGRIAQWFQVRDERNDFHLTPIRNFQLGESPITVIEPEQRRKGFIAADSDNNFGIFHSTSERELLRERISSGNIVSLALSPRANTLLIRDASNTSHIWKIENEHPEVSWSSLWGKVWYESYEEPVYSWQSSSASNDFEPKLSLTPLVFGTLKAAFYAMLFAIPLAIMGAIYTAYFMAPRMRRVVKPSIETMEALPTVILGFLAGLWFAPFVEDHLPGMFSLLLVMPFAVLLFAFAWHHLPSKIRHVIPDGWVAALLIPVVIIAAWIAFSISEPIETLVFNGDLRTWLSVELGIDYDQRNALVVGFAMGFAVIPTIFSIAEDAIFSVPKHLTYGSLALGATPWQTLVRVVLLTASPGIFSAIMIGMGRAVGETMIVLMATGNTPVMDMSMFQGMRTLAANIAVEMPESEVDSTHYRVLFLAALVLFMFTFAFNTVAEIVRQRLREKYSSL